MVLTVSSALSPVTGLCCHRHRRNLFHRLDTSVGVSGPHDFTVRAQRHSCSLRPSPPAPNVRDDRDTSLLWVRDGDRCRGDLGEKNTGIFLRRGLDSRFGDLPVGQSVIPGRGFLNPDQTPSRSAVGHDSVMIDGVTMIWLPTSQAGRRTKEQICHDRPYRREPRRPA